MLSKGWGKNTQSWREDIKAQLKDMTSEVISTEDGDIERYELGSCASIDKTNHQYICVALTSTDLKTRVVEANLLSLYSSLRTSLSKAREVCSGEPLNIPVMGAGLSRTGIKFNALVNLILIVVFEESKKKKITNDIRIVISKKHKGDLNLMSILEGWR